MIQYGNAKPPWHGYANIDHTHIITIMRFISRTQQCITVSLFIVIIFCLVYHYNTAVLHLKIVFQCLWYKIFKDELNLHAYYQTTPTHPNVSICMPTTRPHPLTLMYQSVCLLPDHAHSP